MDSLPTSLDWQDECPCLREELHRRLAEDPPGPVPVWQTVVVAVTLVIMFGFMMLDKIGPDWVMTTGLVLFMVCEIVTIKEGLAGFANEGILTVMALFVVAEGVGRTGALDYYLGLILGQPKTIAGAQIRLMIPIAFLSAFLNNTPIVAVMIPLTIRWAKKIGVPKQQLLIPLSYATILGGTCTLVGTSTNLVVSGLLQDAYPNEASGNIGLFDLAIYGVPNAMIGMAYMLALAPFLLPYGKTQASTDVDDLLLGARVMPWSPAAGRTYKRSGLGNSGGIFLANVRRAATGNIHRAVSKDFVISVGDELYFTGSVETFGEFCEQHGLQIITTDNLHATDDGEEHEVIHQTKETLGSDAERLQQIRHLSDQIEGLESVESGARPIHVVVTMDETEQIVLVGVDCPDRPGLLQDISNAICQQGLNVRHSEAKVFGDRSLSVWRCERLDSSLSSDLEEVWSAVTSLLKSSSQAVVAKTSGTRVVRAVVTKESGLIGKKPTDVDFRKDYLASIVAYQKSGRNYMMDVEMKAGDLLVLQTVEGSPLLTKPPEDFYDKPKSSGTKKASDESSTDIEGDMGARTVWTNLKVEFDQGKTQGVPQGEFLTAFVVPENSPLVNKSINSMGYHKLPGVVLISIERPRGDSKSDNISPEDLLQVGDMFWYSGSAEAIADMQRIHGLAFYHEQDMKGSPVDLTERRLVQAVVARGSPLVGQTVKDVHFRSVYGGVVIAIQRGSERVHEHPANVKLQTGDVLLVESGPSFVEKYGANYRTFALLSEVENSSPPRPRLFLVCLVLIIASLAVAAVELRSLLITASIVGIVMVALSIITQQEARDALQWDLYITVAAAFGIGSAMTNSGVAEGIATFLVFCGKGLGIGGKHRIPSLGRRLSDWHLS